MLVILFHAFFNWLSVSEAGGQFIAILMSVPVILWAIYLCGSTGLRMRPTQVQKQVA